MSPLSLRRRAFQPFSCLDLASGLWIFAKSRRTHCRFSWEFCNRLQHSVLFLAKGERGVGERLGGGGGEGGGRGGGGGGGGGRGVGRYPASIFWTFRKRPRGSGPPFIHITTSRASIVVTSVKLSTSLSASLQEEFTRPLVSLQPILAHRSPHSPVPTIYLPPARYTLTGGMLHQAKY